MKTYHIESRKEDVLYTGNVRKANWIGHIVRRNWILKRVIEGEVEVREDEEEDVSSYWITLSKKRILEIKKKKGSTRRHSVETSL